MAKRNKLKKKRLKRHIRNRFLLVSKEVPAPMPAVEITPAMQFQTRLNEIYGDSIEPLNRFVSYHATLCFKCHECGVRFFARPSYMVGAEHQRHLCKFPCADRHGTRLEKVSGRYKSKSQTNPKQIEQQFHEMVWNDFTAEQIAQKLQVNPKIVKFYFESEGLI